MNLEKLKDEIPFQWKIQSYVSNKTKAICVGYIDSRDAQSLLDEVCGQGGWQDEYYQVGNMLMCRVGIKIGDEWVWKSDTGSESNMEKEKGHSSDAFKRACVKWGIGRFLYDLPIEMVDVQEKNKKHYAVDNNGNILYSGDQLTEFITARKNGNVKPATKKPDPFDTMKKAKTLDEVKQIWEGNKHLHKNESFKTLTHEMKDKFITEKFEEVKGERLAELEKDTQNIN